MSVDLMAELDEAIDVTPPAALLDDLPAPDNERATIKYPVADNVIAELSARYMPLTIAGIDDKQGYKLVHAAYMQVKGLRTDVEKTRKELKADALAWGRKVDGEAKRLKELLEPIEEHLKAEKDAIAAEKARIKQERLDERLQKLAAVMDTLTPASIVDAWSDDEFETALRVATENFERQQAEEAERKRREEAERAELERLRAEEQARQAAEQKQLQAERAELEAMRAEQERLKAELEAERNKLAEEARQKERDAERERMQAEAIEQARREAEKAAEIAEEQRLQAEREAVAREALKPDLVKLHEVAEKIAAIEIPTVAGEAEPRRQEILKVIGWAVSEIQRLATA